MIQEEVTKHKGTKILFAFLIIVIHNYLSSWSTMLSLSGTIFKNLLSKTHYTNGEIYFYRNRHGNPSLGNSYIFERQV